MGVDDCDERLCEPVSTADRTIFPARNSSPDALEDQHVESTAIPIVRITPAIPGSVSVAPKDRQARQQQNQVEDQRDHRVKAGQPVIEET